MYILYNFLLALWHLPKMLRKGFASSPNPKLIMTLLVKDEADIIEQNLLFHKAMGVDAFVVTDNASTDGTLEILRKYEAKGWIVSLIEEPSVTYEQKQWVNRMVRIAADQHQADWIINADADEFWFAPSHSLKKELATVRSTKLVCQVRNVRPVEGVSLTQWKEVCREASVGLQRQLSPFSLYGRTTRKVMHRALGYLKISMGNHKALMLWNSTASSDVIVYHFNLRSLSQFMQKIENGLRSLEQIQKHSVGRHWRYWGEELRTGNAQRLYDQVIGTHCVQALRSEGALYTDDRLAQFFIQHPETLVENQNKH